VQNAGRGKNFNLLLDDRGVKEEGGGGCDENVPPYQFFSSLYPSVANHTTSFSYPEMYHRTIL